MRITSRSLVGLAYIFCALFNTAHANTMTDRPMVARSLLMNLIRADGGSDARVITAQLALPNQQSSRDFLLSLQASWQNNQGRQSINVPLPVKNWGSGGGNSPWQFKDAQMQLYFKNLFSTAITGLRNQGYAFQLSKNDLFHGHIFSFEHDGFTDFGIVFHAKEYPNDADIVEQSGGKGADSSFSTADTNYKLRNLIWIASASKIWAIHANRPALTPLITVEWFDSNSSDPILQNLYRLQLKALTVQDGYFSDLGRALGSINFFSRETILQLTNQPSSNTTIQDTLYF
ncbi:hypothetical protein [Chitinimonas sp. BJB300]|uniref:hypothetical protein n=1 Tax=Chitinimonas sp. BJB300 TaxID=1559339 RepID=UPI000C0E34A2|nr:hypothetical protein [Chitinimonas sp. BJB300]PHV09964.1 hypothetical protein CSQ89_18775 [Chitinimonas sp. BJB300]TSJ90781.1 hypothetical protein FG002_000210 [Chitinimonas sp. BJB300]